MWVEERRRLRVAGEIPPRQEATFETPVPDPLALVGGAALEALSRAGVSVAKGVRFGGGASDRARGEEVGRIENSLRLALRVMNKRSQNLYAEVLFKASGLEASGLGSWETGERAVAATLDRRGIATNGLRVVDGSGLSKENRLSAGALP
jgi:D-alanyl-D-alanine carboxypeptidase/D-alanyl-D-alanine-endopeptidase (penicillin-binding protein 4)